MKTRRRIRKFTEFVSLIEDVERKRLTPVVEGTSLSSKQPWKLYEINCRFFCFWVSCHEPADILSIYEIPTDEIEQWKKSSLY
jgi:hypothetical protein